MNKLTPKELQILYINFTYYRDSVCNGHSDIPVNEFYSKYGLNGHDTNIG